MVDDNEQTDAGLAGDYSDREKPPREPLKITDFIAIAGFILAFGNVAWSISQANTSYDLEFNGPEQIELRCDRTDNDDSGTWCDSAGKLSITASAFSYINHGLPDKGAVITKESVEATINNGSASDPKAKDLTLVWQWFSNIGDESEDQTVAAAFLVAGKSAVSHETQLLARVEPAAADPYKDSYLWSRLEADAALDQAADTPMTLHLLFSVSVEGESKPRQAACDAVVDRNTAAAFAADTKQLKYHQTLTCTKSKA